MKLVLGMTSVSIKFSKLSKDVGRVIGVEVASVIDYEIYSNIGDEFGEVVKVEVGGKFVSINIAKKNSP